MSAEPGRKTAYSDDLRWRVIYQRIGMGQPFHKIAMNLNIAASTAHQVYKKLSQLEMYKLRITEKDLSVESWISIQSY